MVFYVFKCILLDGTVHCILYAFHVNPLLKQLCNFRILYKIVLFFLLSTMINGIFIDWYGFKYGFTFNELTYTQVRYAHETFESYIIMIGHKSEDNLYHDWRDGPMGNPGFENVIDGYLGEFVMLLMRFMFGEEAADAQREKRSFVFSQSYDDCVGGFTSSNSRQRTNLWCIFDENLIVFGYFMPFSDLFLIFLFFTKMKQLPNVYYAKIVRKYMKNLKQYYDLKPQLKKKNIQHKKQQN